MTSGRMYVLASVRSPLGLSVPLLVCQSVCFCCCVVRIVKLRSKTQQTKHATRFQLGDEVANQQHHESKSTAQPTERTANNGQRDRQADRQSLCLLAECVLRLLVFACLLKGFSTLTLHSGVRCPPPVRSLRCPQSFMYAFRH